MNRRSENTSPEAHPCSETRYYGRLFETAQDGILILDAEEGKVVDANPFMLTLLGYPREELIGKKLWEIAPSDGTEGGKAAFARIQKEDRLRYESLSLQTKEGVLIEAEFVSHAYLVDQRGVIQCNIRDATERKRLERLAQEQVAALERTNAENAELARSNAELEQFSYIASHDLQEPLRAVTGCVQLLQKRYAGKLDARADELIAHAVDGTKRMQTLINDLLALSRVGTRTRPFEPVDCNTVISQVRADLSVAISESNAEVASASLPTVYGDRTQLAQLFLNLIGNAIKFRTERTPVIQISADQKAGEWVFSVADNGIGIDAQHFERIFRVFQRLHTRQQYQGTGIGLAICKKIVERHGGRLWVESHVGVGSVFHFTIAGCEAARLPQPAKEEP